MPMADTPEPLYCADAQEWWRWLENNADTASEVWLAIGKKGSGIPSVTSPEALDAALCFGWIDAVRHALDDTHFAQRYTPRGARSIWSQRNREHVARLIDEGRMQPRGLAEVERAKADGRWDAAYAPASTAAVPDDLASALRENPAASALFEQLDGTNRYAILFRIANVKRAETRARKIAEYVAMLERGETIHPRRGARR